MNIETINKENQRNPNETRKRSKDSTRVSSKQKYKGQKSVCTYNPVLKGRVTTKKKKK